MKYSKIHLIWVLPLSILVGLYGAWVLTWLWGWFVSPVTGLRAIGVAEAYGLALLAGFFKVGLQTMKLDEGNVSIPGLSALVYGLAFTLALVMGYIIHTFV